MKRLLLVLVLVASAAAQKAPAPPTPHKGPLKASVCGAPTPGQPHVCLTWTASVTSGVTYNVYRATTAGGENYAAPLNSSAVAGTFFYDTTDAVGTNYFYTITAVGTGGAMSVPSPEVSAQVPVPPSPATAPAAAID